MDNSQVYSMRLKATSIVESITAMVIILLSFGVGMMIYMNVLRSEKLISKARANLILNQVLSKTKEEKSFKNEKMNNEHIRIIKSVSNYPDALKAHAIKLEAFNTKGEFILVIKEIVFE